MEQFWVAYVFSNHCVLQREKNISIFGGAAEKCTVTAEIISETNQTIAKNSTISKNGRWLIQLPPLVAQNNCTLIITCEKEQKIYTDISIGEVWIAGGQSNMEFELQNCTEGPEELADEKNPNVRFYYTNKIAWIDEHFYEAEKNTCWQTWDSQWKTAWSAVGYFYAKKLAADLGVTVGVIGCNWGGTSASAWMSREYLEKDLELKTYLDEQEEATKGKSIEQQCREYDDYEKENNEWQFKCNKLYETVPGIEWDEVQRRIGICKWPGPKSCKNPYRPTGLYECMLKRIMPYTVKGVIWYQGESDDHKPAFYYKLFAAMIEQWRSDWNEQTLPFIFVQLPIHRYKQDKDFKHWCFIREAQQKIHDTIKNTYMTCAFDLGQYNDIHPKAKKELAQRMEKIALAKVYGKECKNEQIFSPMLKSSLVLENKIILTFENAENGFIYKADDITMKFYKEMEEAQKTPVPADFTGFEIAGSDGIYHPAEYTFGTDENCLNTIVLTCKKVERPFFARYGWFNYGPVAIFGCRKDEKSSNITQTLLPLAPFRTSTKDTKTSTEHAAIQQIMTV